VFFYGGDQQRIFDAFDHDREILEALRARYHEGVTFAGTSAGTAIMSLVAIAGGSPESIDGTLVPTHEGLGLLPGAIVDQHFLRRSRENRLFGLVLLHPELLGIGIDQDTSFAIEDGRWGEVIGPGDVMMVDAQRIPRSLVVTLLKPGTRVDLHLR
jgi:cyanophycinase